MATTLELNKEVVYLNVDGIGFPLPIGSVTKLDLEAQLTPHHAYPPIWKKMFNPGDVVLDVGAYIGVVSVHLGLLGGIVHAFEGSPRNVPRLRKVCRPLRQIMIHPVALSDHTCRTLTRFNDCIDWEHQEQEIEFVVFDEYARQNEIPDPSFVKMDIEGMETVALHGMHRLIEAVRPIWQIEFHGGASVSYSGYPGFVEISEGGFDFEQFIELDYVVLTPFLELTAPSEMKALKNYFFVPAEKLDRVINT